MQTIDPECKQLRPLAEYAKRLPSSRLGKRIHKSTLFRWATKGSRGVKLRTERLGAGRYTCDADVAEFMRRLSGEPCSARAPARIDPEPPAATDVRGWQRRSR